MKTRIMRIGNSYGVRIPKQFIVVAGLGDEVEISVQGDSLVIKAAKKAREGWEAAFQEMARCSDDGLLLDFL